MATRAQLPRRASRARTQTSPKRAALLMGLGLGGFVDGILPHQILQWHHMLTGEQGGEPMSTVAGLEANTLADGFFHVATWIMVAVASWLTLRAWQEGEVAPPWAAHIGMLLAGWGIFNVVEGLVDHQLLGIHHVRDDLGAPIGWDIGFLASSVALIAIGLLLARSGERIARRGAEPASD